MVVISPYNDKLPAEAVEAAETVRKAIADGSLHPFAGPINDQSGAERVAAGETLSDEALLGMDWYVEGVSSYALGGSHEQQTAGSDSRRFSLVSLRGFCFCEPERDRTCTRRNSCY